MRLTCESSQRPIVSPERDAARCARCARACVRVRLELLKKVCWLSHDAQLISDLKMFQRSCVFH